MGTLMQERIGTVRKAVNFEKTDRIPTHSNYWTYMIPDAGFTLREAIYDYDKLEEAVIGFHKKYNFDFYSYTGQRNPFKATDPLNANKYVFDESGEQLSLPDYHIMEEDEYPELIADPNKFLWKKGMARKCPGLSCADADERFLASIKGYNEHTERISRINERMIKEFEVPKINMFVIPIHIMMSHLRGMKGISIDLRRRTDLVVAANNALAEAWGSWTAIDEILGKKDGGKAIFRGDSVRGGGKGIYVGDDETEIFCMTLCILAHSVMNRKQWELIFMPYLSKILRNAEKADKPLMLFSEAAILRFADYFRDVPKGVLMIQPEIDDVFELRRVLPNAAICGGMTTDYLGRRSKEECLDFGKKLIEELGSNGGFVMGQDKMVSYRNDAKPENIMAIQELCANYHG